MLPFAMSIWKTPMMTVSKMILEITCYSKGLPATEPTWELVPARILQPPPIQPLTLSQLEILLSTSTTNLWDMGEKPIPICFSSNGIPGLLVVALNFPCIETFSERIVRANLLAAWAFLPGDSKTAQMSTGLRTIQWCG